MQRMFRAEVAEVQALVYEAVADTLQVRHNQHNTLQYFFWGCNLTSANASELIVRSWVGRSPAQLSVLCVPAGACIAAQLLVCVSKGSRSVSCSACSGLK
jgi:hypothetical protein